MEMQMKLLNKTRNDAKHNCITPKKQHHTKNAKKTLYGVVLLMSDIS